MVNVTTPKALRSLLIGAALTTGLVFAGCNAGQISGATSDDAAVHSTSNAAHLTNGGGGSNGGGGTTPYGDHNNDCTVDPDGC